MIPQQQNGRHKSEGDQNPSYDGISTPPLLRQSALPWLIEYNDQQALVGAAMSAKSCSEVGRLELEHVFGLTIPSGAAFSGHAETGRLAYTAGCTIVVTDIDLRSQTHLINSSKNEIISVAFSPDGKLIAAGESGLDPCVRLWDLATKQEIATFKEHKFAIPFVVFSPDQKYLVSVGNQNDQTIILWDVERKLKLYPAKATCKINAVSFSPDSGHFITVGVRFARLWYIREDDKDHSVCLEGSAPNGPTSTKTFTAVTYVSPNRIIAATAKTLCQITIEEKSTRWKLSEAETKVDDIKLICFLISDQSGDNLYAACSSGFIKTFNCKSLNVVETSPFRPNPLGKELDEDVGKNDKEAKCGDCVALAFAGPCHLAAIYSNHIVAVWNVSSPSNVTSNASKCYHASNILDFDVCPAVEGAERPNIVATCSSDTTIRFWKGEDRSLLKIIYCNETDLTALSDKRSLENLRKNNENEGSPVKAKQPSMNNASSNSDQLWIASNLIFRPDGKELAVGFKNGILRIYNLKDFTVQHESRQDSKEISAMAYSRFRTDSSDVNLQFLAIGGWDFKNINILIASSAYAVQQTIKSGHSSFVNALKFAQSSKDSEVNRCWLISSSQDKLLVFYEGKLTPDASTASPTVKFKGQLFALCRSVSVQCSPHDMFVDTMQETIALACHDRKIRLYDIASGKMKCSYLGTGIDSKITHQLKKIDCQTSELMATVCSDKTISLLSEPWEEYDDVAASTWQNSRQGNSERVFAMASGHGDYVNGVKFLPEQKLASISADCCMFLWKVDYNPVARNSSLRRSTTRIRPKSSDPSSSKLPVFRAKSAAASTKPDHSKPWKSFDRSVSAQPPVKTRPLESPRSPNKPDWNRSTQSAKQSEAKQRRSRAVAIGNKLSEQLKIQKAVDNLVTSVGNFASAFDALKVADFEPEKKTAMLTAVKEASQKLNTLLQD